jgi:hypothetical protein
MKNWFTFLFLLAAASTAILYPKFKGDYISNYSVMESGVVENLDKTLEKWSFDYKVEKPKLYVRFNRTNEGYYNPNQISILVMPDYFFEKGNSDFLQVTLAHEFGHHWIRKNLDKPITPEDEEKYADIVALKLVGFDKMKSVLEEEMYFRDNKEAQIFSDRIQFLDNINNFIQTN